MITNGERLEWLINRVEYLEHKNKHGVSARNQKFGGWWPQNDSDHCPPEQGMEGLDLLDYIDAQIKKDWRPR